MSAKRSSARQTVSGVGGAHSHQCLGPLALLPSAEREEFAALHAAVACDWGPRDAYERHWVMELVTSMWRQDRLRGLELATLTAAAAESPPSESTVKKLDTYARYGSRIDKDIGRALQALRVLRKRPDAWIEEERECTSEPAEPEVPTRHFTNEPIPCTFELDGREPQEANCTIELAARTCEPEPANRNLAACTAEPERRLNRHERRRLAAMRRGRAA